MDDSTSAFFLGLIVGIVLATFLGSVLSEGKLTVENAVKHCGAYHHPQTGKFTWKKCE